MDWESTVYDYFFLINKCVTKISYTWTNDDCVANQELWLI